MAFKCDWGVCKKKRDTGEKKGEIKNKKKGAVFFYFFQQFQKRIRFPGSTLQRHISDIAFCGKRNFSFFFFYVLFLEMGGGVCVTVTVVVVLVV